MKVLLWAYAIIGSMLATSFFFGAEVLEKYATGPFYVLMVGAPVVFICLIALPFAARFGIGR